MPRKRIRGNSHPIALDPCHYCKDGNCPYCEGEGAYDIPENSPHPHKRVECRHCGGDGKCNVCRGEAFRPAVTEQPPYPNDAHTTMVGNRAVTVDESELSASDFLGTAA